MPTQRIVNASPLILLTKIGRIDLRNADDVDVVVPVPAPQEVSPGPADPVVQAIGGPGWTVAPLSPVPETRNQWKLDQGEESVLAIALQNPGCEVVIDDRAGQRCAEAADRAAVEEWPPARAAQSASGPDPLAVGLAADDAGGSGGIITSEISPTSIQRLSSSVSSPLEM